MSFLRKNAADVQSPFLCLLSRLCLLLVIDTTQHSLIPRLRNTSYSSSQRNVFLAGESGERRKSFMEAFAVESLEWNCWRSLRWGYQFDFHLAFRHKNWAILCRCLWSELNAISTTRYAYMVVALAFPEMMSMWIQLIEWCQRFRSGSNKIENEFSHSQDLGISSGLSCNDVNSYSIFVFCCCALSVCLSVSVSVCLSVSLS